MIRRPPRSTQSRSSAASDVYKRQPKWREVNLAASLPGFKRSRAAEAWLAGRSDQPARPMAASASAAQAPGLPEALIMSKEQQEALFTRFIEWRRGKEH